MAIEPTPNNSIYKGLVFDDVDSRDYGIYITGDAVFNSPERDVEMIEIPGRNGTYALDKGRFHNIEVTYPAGLFGGSETDFAAGIRAFRNALASRIGYKRLEDDYNPDEYRMAVYSSGLDVTPAQLKAGEFTIEFDCMPQRWLKSGETAVTVASGGTITNPTLFASSPLLIVDGNGTIDLAGNNIVVSRTPYGLLKLYGISGDSEEWSSDTAITWDFDGSLYNSGDPITINRRSNWMGTFSLCCTVHLPPSTARKYSLRDGTTTHTGIISGVGYHMPSQQTTKDLIVAVGQELNFVAGTEEEISGTATIDVIYEEEGIQNTATVTVSIVVAYDGNDAITVTTIATASPSLGAITYHRYLGEISVVSSKYPGDSLYIDLDLGEAYTYEGTEIISLNNSVSLPADLPTLKAGANEITFDNTITSLKIVPRWWEV